MRDRRQFRGCRVVLHESQVIHDVFLRRRQGILAREALLHAPLYRLAVFTATSQVIGQITQIDPLDVIGNGGSGFFHPPDPFHGQRAQWLLIVQDAPIVPISHI